MSEDVVLYEVADRVATITLNRPERLNAWTTEMGNAYFDRLQESADRDDVVVVVVTGAGRGWCAGADMQGLMQLSGGAGIENPDEASGGGNERLTRPMTFPTTVPKLIIGAINGACAGLGLAQALVCDMRFAATGAKLTTSFSRRGLIAEHSLSWTLPRLVGHAAAMDLLASGRTIIAEEALELGMVNKVFQPDRLMEHTLNYARDVAANCSPTSIAVIKQQLYAQWSQPLDQALRFANKRMNESGRRPDFREGVMSFMEKRPPKFPALDASALE